MLIQHTFYILQHLFSKQLKKMPHNLPKRWGMRRLLSVHSLNTILVLSLSNCFQYHVIFNWGILKGYSNTYIHLWLIHSGLVMMYSIIELAPSLVQLMDLKNKLQWAFNQSTLFSFKKMPLNISSTKWQTICSGLYVLNLKSHDMMYILYKGVLQGCNISQVILSLLVADTFIEFIISRA